LHIRNRSSIVSTWQNAGPILINWLHGFVEKSTREKNPAAVELGRLGGLKGGKARAKKLSAKKRKAIALKAAKVRWEVRIISE
jgi:hypothetical protein